MKDLRSFLRGFVLPLVAGGEAHVAAPIEPAALETWATELSEGAEEIVEIDRARQAVAAELVVRAPTMAFGAEELRLAGALYDTLALAHPAAAKWTARDRTKQRILAASLSLASIGPPPGRREMLERHALLHNLHDLTRQDVVVRWWTGRAEFHGQRPPRRLTRWSGLRRVQVEAETVAFDELLGGEGASDVTNRLLAASPLTDLLTPHRARPSFSWEGAIDVLRDAELARAVAYRFVGDDGGALTAGGAAGAAGRAWEKLLHTSVSQERVRAVTGFLVHLAALVAVIEERARDLDGPSAIVKAALESKDTGLALLLAAPAVAGAIDPRLAAPPGIADDPRIARRFAAHRAQVRAGLGDARLAELTEKLAARIPRARA